MVVVPLDIGLAIPITEGPDQGLLPIDPFALVYNDKIETARQTYLGSSRSWLTQTLSVSEVSQGAEGPGPHFDVWTLRRYQRSAARPAAVLKVPAADASSVITGGKPKGLSTSHSW